MGRLNLVIMDKNTRYMDSLAGYIMENYGHKFSLQLFSDFGAFMAYMQEHASPASIYLVDGELCGEWAQAQGAKLIIALEGGPRRAAAGANSGQPGNARFSVDRFKGADGIISDILRIYTEHDGAAMDAELAHGRRCGRTVLVYSPCGGAGRTSFAIALSAHFAGMRQKALYLNLDWACAEPAAAGAAGPQGMTDIIFYLKAKPEKLGMRLEALRRTDSGGNFDFFAPPDYPMDIDELSPADAELLIGKLQSSGMYDRIAIDTHSGLSARNKALMELADDVLILSESDALSLNKLSMAKEQIDRCFMDYAPSIYKKCAIAINKCAGAGLGPLLGRAGEISDLFGAKVHIVPLCADMLAAWSADATSAAGAGAAGMGVAGAGVAGAGTAGGTGSAGVAGVAGVVCAAGVV
ncbi:MAG: hypothetical protein LBJ10_07350, partial [Clostridiales bacterium]|nr:hypothetical protein [Clostridiales bacterium]